MEHNFDHFTQSMRDTRLSAEASARVRARLIAHMRAHPPLASPYQRFFEALSPATAYFKQPAMALAVIMVVALGGVAASATGGALPGDVLYPFKVNVMEPVKGLLAFSPEAKATWQASLTDTRLREVEQLAVKKRLTPEEGIRSQERFDSSLMVAQETIEELSLKDPEAAAQIDASFSASLGEHERLLSLLGNAATTTQTGDEIHNFAKHVRSKIKKALPADAATSTATTTPSVEGEEEQSGGEVQGAATTTGPERNRPTTPSTAPEVEIGL